MVVVKVRQNLIVKIGQFGSNVGSNYLVGIPVILNRVALAARGFARSVI
jgi:hypothetical protein